MSTELLNYYENIYPKCNRTLSWLASPQVFQDACHIGSILMFILSIYTIFLISKQSPPVMKPMIPLMIHQHVWTIICDFMFSGMLLPYYFLPLVAARLYGFFQFFRVPMRIQIWFAFGALGGMIASIMTVFEHRHRSIVTNSKYVMRRKSTRIIFNLFLYGYHINFGVPEILTMPYNQLQIKFELLKLLPCPPPTYFDDDVIILQENGKTLFNPHMYFTCFSLSCVGFFFCFHTFWFLLPSNNPSMSPSTRKLQRNFFFSMCIQISIPVFVILLPNIYWNLSITFQFHLQEGNSISVFILTLHGISASLSTIFLYGAYRKYTINLIKTKIFRINIVKPSANSSFETRNTLRSHRQQI